MRFILLATVAMIATPALAASTHSCDGLDSINNLVGNVQTFDQVRVAYVSTEEPAVAPDHVLVFVSDDEMGVKCTAISHTADGGGFGYVDITTLKQVGSDAEGRLLFRIDVYEPGIDGAHGKTQTVRFRADEKTGRVTVE